MGATKFYMSGEARWAKVFDHNKDNFKGKTFFSIDLVISDEDYERFRETKSAHKPKKGDDGRWYIQLRRNEDAAREEWGGPPNVIIEDPENPGSYIPFTENIGNGSEVTVSFVVYDAPAFGVRGTRLESVRVDRHVEFGGTKVDTTGIDVPF